MDEVVAATEKVAKVKERVLGFIDQAWIDTLTNPIVTFVLVFALAVLFLARTGLWRGQAAKGEAEPASAAWTPQNPVAAVRARPIQPALDMPAVPLQAAAIIPEGAGAIETLIAQQHAETTARTDRALMLSEEALRLHAAALDELTKMNEALNRLVQQVDGATAAQEM